MLDVNPRTTDDPSASGPAPAPRPAGRRLLRWAVNLWLVFHLTAIVIAPASVGPSSELVDSGWELVRPYLQFLYLNHGYHFFAPEPAESTLLAFVAEREDGTVVRGRIPDFDDPAPAALSPPFHAHRAHEPGPRRAPRGLVSVVRPAHRPQVRRDRGQPDPQTHYLPTMEMVRDGVQARRPGQLRGTAPGGLPMRRLLNPVVRYLADLARSLAEDWDAFWFTAGRPDAAGRDPDPHRPDAALHPRRLGPGAGRLLRPRWLAQRGARPAARRPASPLTRSGGWSPRDGSGRPTASRWPSWPCSRRATGPA